MSIQTLIPISVPFLTILFLLLIGAGLRRWQVVTQEGARQMTWLVLNVSLPPLIFVALATEITPAELSRAPLLVAMGIVGPLTGYVVGALLGRLPLYPRGRRSTLMAAVGMLNTTFIGYTVCEALLGSRGLLYAVMYDAGFTLLMSTICIWLMEWGRAAQTGEQTTGVASLVASLLDLLRTPLMWSVVLGLAWGALGWPMPAWVGVPLQTLGQVTMPLALLTVGMLAFREPAEESPETAKPQPAQLALLTVARLVVTPALVWGLVSLLRVEPTAAAAIVLQTAMPSAVAITAMAEQYGGDSTFAARGIILTTFLSLLTLPAWGWILVGAG